MELNEHRTPPDITYGCGCRQRRNSGGDAPKDICGEYQLPWGGEQTGRERLGQIQRVHWGRWQGQSKDKINERRDGAQRDGLNSSRLWRRPNVSSGIHAESTASYGSTALAASG